MIWWPLLVLIAVCGAYALWTAIRVPGKVRAIGLAVFATVIGIGTVAAASLLGYPKPVGWSPGVGEVEVIAEAYDEGEAIWVWVWKDGGPRAYELPWDTELAETMQAYRGQGGLRLVLGQWSVHPLPVQGLPPKRDRPRMFRP